MLTASSPAARKPRTVPSSTPFSPARNWPSDDFSCCATSDLDPLRLRPLPPRTPPSTRPDHRLPATSRGWFRSADPTAILQARRCCMYPLLLLGAGKIGRSIATFLGRCGDYDVLVADSDEDALARVPPLESVRTLRLDVRDPDALRRTMRDRRCVVSACPYDVNAQIARAALAEAISYFDLTEDVATRQTIEELSRDAAPGQIFMPHCGLAPG